MLGSPGAGTSRLARRLATILPAMRLADARETTRVPPVAGLTAGRPVGRYRLTHSHGPVPPDGPNGCLLRAWRAGPPDKDRCLVGPFPGPERRRWRPRSARWVP